MGFIFLSSTNVLFIDWVLDELFDKNDNGFIHFVADHNTLPRFSCTCHD